MKCCTGQLPALVRTTFETGRVLLPALTRIVQLPALTRIVQLPALVRTTFETGRVLLPALTRIVQLPALAISTDSDECCYPHWDGQFFKVAECCYPHWLCALATRTGTDNFPKCPSAATLAGYQH